MKRKKQRNVILPLSNQISAPWFYYIYYKDAEMRTVSRLSLNILFRILYVVNVDCVLFFHSIYCVTIMAFALAVYIRLYIYKRRAYINIIDKFIYIEPTGPVFTFYILGTTTKWVQMNKQIDRSVFVVCIRAEPLIPFSQIARSFLLVCVGRIVAFTSSDQLI